MSALDACIPVKVDKSPDVVTARTNLVYISQANYDKIPGSEKLVSIKGCLFAAEPSPSVTDDKCRFSGPQRLFLGLEMNTHVNLKFVTGEMPIATEVTMEMSFSSQAKNRKLTLDADAMRAAWKGAFPRVPFNVGQKFVFVFSEEQYLCQVVELKCETIDTNGDRAVANGARMGLFSPNLTHITFRKGANQQMIIEDSHVGGNAKNNFFQPDFNFEDLEIGGLDKEFQTLFRRAFNSRLFPPKIIRERGIKHVKGILLYGPPGTGKTLIARQIGKMLNTVEPKIINGPEVMSSYVGKSEENIRNLFQDARKDQEENGDNSQLHLIIFDEIDSICKKRGSVNSNVGVHDTMVNQLLSMIDGVDALNNVLLIGMTNRKDMIDEALIRPGRLEVQIEIGLPDQAGREQIFKIHTRKLRALKAIGADVDFTELSELAANYTGAEIEGVVKSAQSFALNNAIDATTMKIRPDADMTITRDFFLRALEEVRPAFGVQDNILDTFVPHGIVDYGQKFIDQKNSLIKFLSGLDTEDGERLMTFCISGEPGTGLTSFAVSMANNRFDYIKVVNAKSMVGKSEDAVCQELRNVFEDAYRSRESAIIIDDIDSVIDFSPIGPRFANKIFQACLVFLKERPPRGHKLAVFVTTCARSNLELIGMTSRYFYKELILTPLSDAKEVITIAESILQMKVTLSEQEEKDANEFFKISGNAIPIKRCIEALDIAKRQAKGATEFKWKDIEREIVEHLNKPL